MPIAFSFHQRVAANAARGLIDADDKQMPSVLVMVGTLSGLNGVSASSRR